MPPFLAYFTLQSLVFFTYLFLTYSTFLNLVFIGTCTSLVFSVFSIAHGSGTFNCFRYDVSNKRYYSGREPRRTKDHTSSPSGRLTFIAVALMPLRPAWNQIGCSFIWTKQRFYGARQAGTSINFHPLECWLTASTSLQWSPSANSASTYRRWSVYADACQENGVVLLCRSSSTASDLPICTSTFQKLVVALVHSRLDYGNGVLVGVPAHLMCRLQSVLNAAARLIFNLKRSDHITDALVSLHCMAAGPTADTV